jgi:hypothetical protein
MKSAAWTARRLAIVVLTLNLAVISGAQAPTRVAPESDAFARWINDDGKEDIRVYRDDELATSSTPARSARPSTEAAGDPPYGAVQRLELAGVGGQRTYLQFMTDQVKPALFELAELNSGGSPDANLRAGKGLLVVLGMGQWNYHVNYPKGDQGGRSYGVTVERTGDWSDKTYLNNLDRVVHGSDGDLTTFYRTLIEVIGKSDATGLGAMPKSPQLVANNFIAIYSAEQYRGLVGPSHWDDALLQVTLVAAVHGGQPTLTKYYEGRLTADSFRQAPGVYRGSVNGTPKRAELNDYWQFSANPASQRSGINLTRRDFEAMGVAITTCESGNLNLTAIQATVGSSANVLKGVADYFIRRRSANLGGVSALAASVAAFLTDVKHDAARITACAPQQAS